MYEKIKELTSIAHENAVRLELFSKENGFVVHATEFMPSSEIYHIVDEAAHSDTTGFIDSDDDIYKHTYE